jgi:hypothetical protein
MVIVLSKCVIVAAYDVVVMPLLNVVVIVLVSLLLWSFLDHVITSVWVLSPIASIKEA